MRWFVCFLLLSSACSSEREITDGTIRVELTEAGGLLVTRHETTLLSSSMGAPQGLAMDRLGEAYAPFAVSKTAHRRLNEVYGSYEFEDRIENYEGLEVDSVEVKGDTLHFSFENGGTGTVSLKEGFVELNWRVDGYDRLAMSFDCLDADRFFGLGAQVSAEHRGYRVPIWVQEQGNGKSDRGEIPPVFGLSGYHYQSYAPIPFTLLSRPLGFELVTDYRSEFELCEDNQRFRVELFGGSFGARIYVGESPAEILEDFTALTGRARPVSRWSYGPWVDTLGGPEAIAEAIEIVRSADIPASALWAEDWVGKEGAIGGEHLTYNWEENKELYPDLAGVAASLHEAGMRFLTYVNPMIPDNTRVFEEGSAAGYLVSDDAGHPIELEFPFGHPPSYFDMTRDGAREWYWGYLSRAVDAGIDGWMTDYGESLPYDGLMANGVTGEAFHNVYPLHWAQASRDFWAEKRPDGDFAYFNRSGYTGISGRTHIMWLGDQLVTFDRNDGLGSILPLYLSTGLSGISLNHSDVGGYTSFGSTVRTHELWARWVELEAFTPFMRTHHSANPAANLQWHSNEDTLNHFRRYGKWHQRLLPYWTEVVDAAATTGAPAVRPLWWGEVSNTQLHGVEDAVLVGDDLLLAPIVEEGATSREVRFPTGSWHRWQDADLAFGEALTGTQVLENVGIEDTLLFVRAGAAIPFLSRAYDTLALERVDSPHVQGLEAAPEVFESLTFLLTLGGADSGTLSGHGFGNVTFSWESRELTEAQSAEVANLAAPLCESEGEDCVGSVSVTLEPGENVVSIRGIGSAATFTIEADSLSEVILELR